MNRSGAYFSCGDAWIPKVSSAGSRIAGAFLCAFLCVLFIPDGNAQKTQKPAKDYSIHAEIDDYVIETAQKTITVSGQIIEEGKKFLRKGQLKEALKLFQKAMDLAPFDPRPYYLMAHIYMRFDNDEAAFRVLEKAGMTNTNTDLIFKRLDQVNRQYKLLASEPRPWPLVSIAPFRDNKKAAVSFMFDDGAKYVYTDILPVFEQYGFRATIPVNPGIVPEERENRWWGSWEDWRDADARGHEIANHSMNHRDLSRLPEEFLEEEINKAHQMIREHIGRPPLSFIFPFDHVGDAAMQKASRRHLALREHDFLSRVYKDIFILVYGGPHFSTQTAQRAMEWAVEKNLWILAECHSLESEKIYSFKPLSEEFIRGHLGYLDSQRDKIWVDTMINVYRYLFQAKHTEIKIDEETGNTLVFRLKSSLGPDVKLSPVTVVVNTGTRAVQKAVAVQEEYAGRIPVRIEGGLLIFPAMPGKGRIYVRWDFQGLQPGREEAEYTRPMFSFLK